MTRPALGAASLLVVRIGADDRPAGWHRIARSGDGRARELASGGLPLPMAGPDELLVAVAPADAVRLGRLGLGAMPAAQAAGAARALLADQLLDPAGDTHVAVGPAEGPTRPVALVAAARMAAWLDALAAAGADPAEIWPAVLLPPAPATGFARLVWGDGAVLRAAECAFADDPALTPLLVADTPVVAVALDAAFAAAFAHPPLDLRQGRFARRRRLAVAPARLRRLGALAAALATVSIAVPLAQTIRLNLAAARLEAAAEAAAAPAGGIAALDARLAQRQGGGAGFAATSGALLAGLAAMPTIDLKEMVFSVDGQLRATISAPGAAEVEALVARLRAAGLAVETPPFVTDSGRIRGELRTGG